VKRTQERRAVFPPFELQEKCAFLFVLPPKHPVKTGGSMSRSADGQFTDTPSQTAPIQPFTSARLVNKPTRVGSSRVESTGAIGFSNQLACDILSPRRHDMTRLRRLLAVCIGLVLVGAGSPLTATETIFAGIPIYSVMSTVDTDLSLPTIGANAFTPLNIPCPASAGTNGCTFRVTVSAVVTSPGGDPILQVSTAPFITVSPTPVIHIDLAGSFPAPFTMQWVIKNVPAGSAPEVQVIGAVTSGAGIMKQRTLSIDVFNGLV
jgi:hypothetical protein